MLRVYVVFKDLTDITRVFKNHIDLHLWLDKKSNIMWSEISYLNTK